MNTVNSFTIYREYYDLITLLSNKEQANVLLAIVNYVFEDKEIKLSDRERKVFVNLKRPLDKSKNKSKSTIKLKSNQNQIEIKSKSKQDTHQDVYVYVNDNVNVNGNVNNNIYSYIEENFNRTLSPIEYEMISEWEDTELTRYAIKQAVLNGAYNVKYISRILSNFSNRNIRTVQEAQKYEKEFKAKKDKVITTEWLDKEINQDIASDEDIKKLEERMRRVKNEN